MRLAVPASFDCNWSPGLQSKYNCSCWADYRMTICLGKYWSCHCHPAFLIINTIYHSGFIRSTFIAWYFLFFSNIRITIAFCIAILFTLLREIHRYLRISRWHHTRVSSNFDNRFWLSLFDYLPGYSDINVAIISCEFCVTRMSIYDRSIYLLIDNAMNTRSLVSNLRSEL